MGLTQSLNIIQASGAALPFDGFARECYWARSTSEAVHASSITETDCLRKVSEQVLIRQARAGDQDAFVELCDRYGFRVKQRILRIVRNREDSEDVFQETLMRAFKHLDGFHGRCSFQTWITQIAINSALMLLRRRRIHPEVGFEILGADGETICRTEAPDPSPNPEQLYLKQQKSQMLSIAVTNLPSNFRSIVEQYHCNELKLSEAAQVLGLKQAAAKSRLLRARALLRRRLQSQVSGRL